jgi:hypothetical protein
VRAAVTATRQAQGTLEVALVCTEFYDVKTTVLQPDGDNTTARVTQDATEYAEAKPLSGEVIFTVPAGGPVSYAGRAVSAVWCVRVTEKRPRGRDRQLDTPIWVAP